MRRYNRTSIERWFIGIGVAAIPFVYGIYCLIVQRSCFFIARITHFHYVVTGWAAIVLAVAYIAFGMALHLLYFWSQHPRFGKIQYWLMVTFLFYFVMVLQPLAPEIRPNQFPGVVRRRREQYRYAVNVTGRRRLRS
jgi:hypothetical protein